MFFDRRGEHVDNERVVAERQAHIRQLLDRDELELFQPRDLRPDGAQVAGIVQSRAAPEIEGLGQQRHRGGGLPATPDLPGEDDQPLEALHVELVGLDPQQVPVRACG